MPHPKNKTAQRGLVAAAATALVVGSSFMPAAAAPEVSSTPAPSASDSATTSGVDTKGIDKAIERDLGKTVEKYVEDSKANETAAAVREELKKQDIAANARVKDGKAEVEVSKKDAAKAKKVIEASPAAAHIVMTEVNASVKTVEGVFDELVENVKPEELKRLSSIMNTKDGLKIYAHGLGDGSKPSKSAKKATASSDRLTLEQFIDEAKYVSGAPSGGPAKTSADTDVYGGLAYGFSESGDPYGQIGYCSLGFTAWAPSGDDAILSAGHCTNDDTMKIFGLLEQTEPDGKIALGKPLGTFGFNQFGGAGHSGIPLSEFDGLTEAEVNKKLAAAEPGTDIAVIEDINPALTLHPALAQWPEGKAPRDQVLNLTGVSKAVVGAEACSVGRTTGWGCAEVTGVGVFFVNGYKDDLRAVWGYESKNPGQTILDQGDSGGAMVVGTKAVGINSATNSGEDRVENTDDDTANYTSLDDVFKKGYIDGYQVKFVVNDPVVSTENGATVAPKAVLKGVVKDASAGTIVRVVVDGKVVQTVKVDSKGNFSFTAPAEAGKFDFQLLAVNGFNKSDRTNGSVVVEAPEPTPTPTETPTEEPTQTPTEEPTQTPTEEPTQTPTEEPTQTPTEEPTQTPTEEPTQTPTEEPTQTPTEEPTESATPTEKPTQTPTEKPTESATPTEKPTQTPTEEPSESAKPSESKDPSEKPSESKDSTEAPSKSDDSNNKDDSKKEQPKQEAPKKDDPLADTGANTVPMIAAGAALALTGAAFLLFRRSARRHG